MINLRLANEFGAPPLFCTNPDKMGHVEVESLPISQHIKDKVLKWDSNYQSIYNDADPVSSKFRSLEEKSAHLDKGYELARILQEELGQKYAVIYSP